MSGERWRALLVCAVAAAWGLWVCAHAYTNPGTWSPAFLDRGVSAAPWWGSALWRAARAIVGAGLVYLAAWQLGRHCGRTLDTLTASRLEQVLFVGGIGLVLLSSLLLGLAWLSAYRPLPVFALTLAAAASRPRAVVAELRHGAGVCLASVRRAFTRPADALFLACAAAGMGFSLVAALAPETEYDALWYHLWLPTRWLAAGRPADIVTEYISLYPGGWELLNGAAMVAGGPIAAKLLHFGCLPLAAASGAALAARVVPGVSRTLVVALATVVPTMLWEGATAYVDLALAFYVTLAAVALFRYDDTADRRWLLVAGAVAGGALGVKHLGLVALAIFAAFVAVRQRRRGGWRSAAAAVALFTALALALALPWYARAYAASGNPVFPEMYRVFGARPESRWSPATEAALDRFKAHFGVGRHLPDLVLLPWTVTTSAARFGGDLGPLFLVLVPFAVLARPWHRVAVVALGVAAYALVWASPVSSLQLRFLLPAVPALAVLAAAGGEAVIRRAGELHRTLAAAPVAAIVLLLVINLPPFVDLNETVRRGWDGWLTNVLRAEPLAVVIGAEPEEEYLARMVPAYSAWSAIDATTPTDARVLTFFGGDQLYSHRARLWSDAAAARPVTWGATHGEGARMLAAARDLGITHVLFDKRLLADPQVASLAIAEPRIRACCLVPFYEDSRTVVYRLDPGRHAPGE